MIKVAGHWEQSWNTPIAEMPLWNFPMVDYGVSELYMWPVSGIINNERRSFRIRI